MLAAVSTAAEEGCHARLSLVKLFGIRCLSPEAGETVALLFWEPE